MLKHSSTSKITSLTRSWQCVPCLLSSPTRVEPRAVAEQVLDGSPLNAIPLSTYMSEDETRVDVFAASLRGQALGRHGWATRIGLALFSSADMLQAYHECIAAAPRRPFRRCVCATGAGPPCCPTRAIAVLDSTRQPSFR